MEGGRGSETRALTLMRSEALALLTPPLLKSAASCDHRLVSNCSGDSRSRSRHRRHRARLQLMPLTSRRRPDLKPWLNLTWKDSGDAVSTCVPETMPPWERSFSFNLCYQHLIFIPRHYFTARQAFTFLFSSLVLMWVTSCSQSSQIWITTTGRGYHYLKSLSFLVARQIYLSPRGVNLLKSFN